MISARERPWASERRGTARQFGPGTSRAKASPDTTTMSTKPPTDASDRERTNVDHDHPTRQPTHGEELYRSEDIETVADGETVYQCPRDSCDATADTERGIKCHFSTVHDQRLVRFRTCEFCGQRFELDRDKRSYCSQTCVNESRRDRPDDPYQLLYVLYVHEDRSLEDTADRMPDHTRREVREMARGHDMLETTLSQQLSEMDPEDLGLTGV